MRVSVTISDEMNKYFTDSSKDMGISKDKLIGSILINHMKSNPRGAGRKSIFTEEDILNILSLHELGKSYRDIAKQFNCSHSTVHKLISRHSE